MLFLRMCVAVALQTLETPIEGTVDQVLENAVHLLTETEDLPNVGDKVEIYVDVPGFKRGALAASGTVEEIDGEIIHVKLESGREKVFPGLRAKVFSETPGKKRRLQPGRSELNLYEEEWRPWVKGEGARSEFPRDGQVVLSVSKAEEGQASYLVSQGGIVGDFDLSVRVDLLTWASEPGPQCQAALMVARPEGSYSQHAYIIQRVAYLQQEETIDEWIAWEMQDRAPSEHASKEALSAGTSFYLRLTRRGEKLTAFHAGSAKEWVEDARFNIACPQAVYVVLGVANAPTDEGAQEFPAVRARFSELMLKP